MRRSPFSPFAFGIGGGEAEKTGPEYSFESLRLFPARLRFGLGHSSPDYVGRGAGLLGARRKKRGINDS